MLGLVGAHCQRKKAQFACRYVTDGLHPHAVQLLECYRPDTPEHSHIQRMQKLKLGTWRNFEHSGAGVDSFACGPWLGKLCCQFGDELVRSDSNTARQTNLCAHRLAHLLCHGVGITEDSLSARDVEKCFIKRQAFD